MQNGNTGLVRFDVKYKGVFEAAIGHYRGVFNRDIYGVLTQHFGTRKFPEITTLEAQIKKIGNHLNVYLENNTIGMDPSLLPCLRSLITRFRRHEAEKSFTVRQKTTNVDLVKQLAEELSTIDALIDEECFAQTKSLSLPKITDFFTPDIASSLRPIQLPNTNLKRDDKFHILLAPDVFIEHLSQYRNAAEMHDLLLAVIFIDVDNFKSINSTYTESVVDVSVLPPLMREIERYFHFYGKVYKQGGDEYLIIIAGFSKPVALQIVDELRRKISFLQFSGIKEQVTLSSGLVIVYPDCHLTNEEIRMKANIAKNHAKKKDGKNSIFGFVNNTFRDRDVEELTGFTPSLYG